MGCIEAKEVSLCLCVCVCVCVCVSFCPKDNSRTLLLMTK